MRIPSSLKGELKKVILGLFFISLMIASFALESRGAEVRKTQAIKVSSPVKIDGNLSDEAWENIDPIRGFIQFSPFHGEPSPEKRGPRIALERRSQAGQDDLARKF